MRLIALVGASGLWLPVSVERPGRAHAARISAILSGAALRWDSGCLQEAHLGDVILLPAGEMTDFSIFW